MHLLEAPDPAAYAQRAALRYQDGRVFVTALLQAPEGDLAQRYSIRVEARGGAGGVDLLSGYMPLATLCDVSNDSRVRFVGPVTMLQSPKPDRP